MTVTQFMGHIVAFFMAKATGPSMTQFIVEAAEQWTKIMGIISVSQRQKSIPLKEKDVNISHISQSTWLVD